MVEGWKAVSIREEVYSKLFQDAISQKRKVTNLIDIILSDYLQIPSNAEVQN